MMLSCLYIAALSFLSPAMLHSASQVSFEELFTLQSEIELVGTEEAPLFHTSGTLITDQRIYLCATFESKILIFDRQGNLLHILGRKGNGPGEFLMPQGITGDRQGNLYVNDRSASRIQVFSPELVHQKTLKVIGNYENIFVGDFQGRESLVLTGMGIGKNDASCMIGIYSFDGTKQAAFAEIPKGQYIAAYLSTQDEQGNFYVCNVDDSGVTAYDPNVENPHQLNLAGPSWAPFDYDNLPKEYNARKRRIDQRQKTEPFTNIIQIEAYKNLLFVFLLRRNFPESKTKLVLDIFNQEGNPVLLGIDVPHGYISHEQETFYFYGEYNDEDWGTSRIREYKLQTKWLKEALGP